MAQRSLPASQTTSDRLGNRSCVLGTKLVCQPISPVSTLGFVDARHAGFLFSLEPARALSNMRLDPSLVRPVLRATVQGRRADKKLARGEVPPLLLKIDGFVGLETAFAFKNGA